MPPERFHDYGQFLRSRWPARTRALAKWAAGGTFAFMALDVVFTAPLADPPSLAAIAAFRLPWLAVPIAGWLLQRHSAGWRFFPSAILVLSLAWTAGNDWAFFALGLAGSVVQAIGITISFATAATLLPLTLRGRLGVFALMGLGHLALDLAWPQVRPLGIRLWTDAVVLLFVASQTFIFEHFARSQRRGFHLRLDLQRAVDALQVSGARAASAAAAVGRLAAEVAHEVNNPLAAVKANVRILGEREPSAEERAELARETLEAIDRISRIVADLRVQALEHQGLIDADDPRLRRPGDR